MFSILSKAFMGATATVAVAHAFRGIPSTADGSQITTDKTKRFATDHFTRYHGTTTTRFSGAHVGQRIIAGKNGFYFTSEKQKASMYASGLHTSRYRPDDHSPACEERSILLRIEPKAGTPELINDIGESYFPEGSELTIKKITDVDTVAVRKRAEIAALVAQFSSSFEP